LADKSLGAYFLSHLVLLYDSRGGESEFTPRSVRQPKPGLLLRVSANRAPSLVASPLTKPRIRGEIGSSLARLRGTHLALWSIPLEPPPGLFTDPVLTPLPPDAELLVVTHILELPHDLGFTGTPALALFEPRTDLFGGWSDEEKAHLVSSPPPPDPGTSPVTRLVFKHTWIRGRPPLVAADNAFESFATPLLPKRSARRRRWQRRLAGLRGLSEPVTVVAATRFIPAQDWPQDRENQEAILGRELDASIDFLNDFILSVGLIRNDPRLIPIARGDLPIVCPVILEVAPRTREQSRLGTSFAYPIHAEATYTGFEPRRDDAEVAFHLARSNYYGAQPFFLFYELMQRALQSFNTHRFSQAMLALGSAMEVLIAVVVRESSALMGEAPNQAEKTLSAGLSNILKAHFGRYASITVDLSNPTNPVGRWWQGGYKLRNRVVHEGHRPDEVETRGAFDDAMAFVGEVRDGLRSNATTRALGEFLQWGQVP
jgi:hypothetical protein